MFHFLLLISRQGKVRLAKWLEPYSQKERTKTSQELATLLTARSSKMCNFIEWRDLKVVYRRYASLFFVAGVDSTDNELITLEIIHHYVECLDKYFGNQEIFKSPKEAMYCVQYKLPIIWQKNIQKIQNIVCEVIDDEEMEYR
ncbi:AP-1 complex subunit sigma-1 [Galdieria sulphuraria]|nr:AP-1 complex subunit sigma-1 [Galdieria sulphuraria]